MANLRASAQQPQCRKARLNIPANGQKLTVLEEAPLKKWILDMDERGLPPTQDMHTGSKLFRAIDDCHNDPAGNERAEAQYV
ncbi:hypothetical protein GB937_004391 [Aspergillus fischeri]|nr:hypothetical protein GB937_004391 [Aspergillus fischeri]